MVIKIDDMFKYFFISILFSSCLASSIHRPGIQIKNPGVLNNEKDTIKVLLVISFSTSFEDKIRSQKFNVDTDFEKTVVTKLNFFLADFLNEKNLNFKLNSMASNLINMSDSIIRDIDSGNDPSLWLGNFTVNERKNSKILLMRFNYNTDTHQGFSSLLGSVGQTDTYYELTSHAILIGNSFVFYHRSNVVKLPFVENFFYKRSISRVLNEAFKK